MNADTMSHPVAIYLQGGTVPSYFYLTPVLGGPGAPRYPVTTDGQVIGRSEEAEIALLEPTVSRRHASIELQDGDVWLEDLQSKHGSFVNSKRVSRLRLKVGDIVVFGLSIVLRLEEADEEVPPAMPLRLPGDISSPFGPVGTSDMPAPDLTRQHLLAGDTAMHQAIPSEQKQTRALIRTRDELVKARKMAAAGGFCLTVIPDVQRRLTELCARLRKEPDSCDAASMLADLEPLQDALAGVLEATEVFPSEPTTPTDLWEAVRQAVKEVKDDANLHRSELNLDVARDLWVMADPLRLQTAVNEFLKSAIRSGRSGATVQIQAIKGADKVSLVISNQNLEMSSSGRHRVFDPFVTTDAHWHRLGLGIFEARQIVMSFGGTVTLESGESLGTAVAISLAPAEPPE